MHTDERSLAGASGVIAAFLLAVLASACGEDHPEGCLGDCECVGSDCVCPGSGDCDLLCSDDCDLQCAGSGSCFFECDDGCLTSCTGSGECVVNVGTGSSIECPGSGGCDVLCRGDCSVSCPGNGDCIVRCAEGAICELSECSGSVVECPDFIQVCNGGCPA